MTIRATTEKALCVNCNNVYNEIAINYLQFAGVRTVGDFDFLWMGKFSDLTH